MKKSINTETEANKVDKVIISYLTSIWLSNNDFDTNFTISWKDRPDVAIKDKFWKYCIIFENKKDFKDLIWAKNQGLKYLEQLKNLNLLSDKILLIRTNMSTFHADEYKIKDEEIVWNKDITSIDILDDIKIELIKNYTHPKNEEEVKLLSTDKRELKKAFDWINNFLRDKWLWKDQRLHITMAILFLKLIKENNDLLESIDESDSKKDLIEELQIIKNNITEKSIVNVFEAVNKVYNKEFHFDMEQYKNKNILTWLFDIADKLNLSNYDLDIKWEAFEYFINYWNTSSDMWEYFTPRHLVRFMVMLLDEAFIYNREQLFGKTYFDPTCWTGGFLIEVFKHLKDELKNTKKDTPENIKKLKEKSVYGNELNLRSSEIAKMNMILTWDWHSNINQWDFIAIKDERKNEYDVSIWNPPFWNNREWEFVDWFLKDVKAWWYSIFLVPEWVLFKADKNFVEIRRTLLNKWKLLKVISLPQWAFLPYTWVKTDIIFWLNEAQSSDYDIEFIDIKNDWFSLDANRKELKNSDLTDYFENKQKLIDNWQIWNVNSSQIYDKTKLNQLELEKSKLELEAKETIKKLDIMKKQLKQIDNKEEGKQKETKILEFQEKLENIKKQTKKIWDKLKSFDLSLVVNRYKVQKEINKNIDYESFIDLVEYLPKSKRQASEWKESWKYPFFTSSEIQNKWVNEFDYEEECLILWTWWKSSIHFWKEFSTSTDNFIVSTIKEKILTKYLYFLLKYNISILESWFQWAWLKHISKEYLNNLQIPVSSIEYQEEIVKEIEEYEKIIFSAIKIIETCKPKIKIKKEWEIVEIWDLFEIIDWDRWENYPTKDEFFNEWYCLFLNTKNVLENRFNFDEKSFISKEKDELLRNWKLQKWDIVLTTRWTLWNIAYFDENINFENIRINSWMVILRPNKNILHKYMIFLFQTNYIKTYIDLINSWSAQPQLPIKELRQIKISLPSLEEQEKIVEELEEEQKLVDANKQLIKIFENKIKNVIHGIWEGRDF